VSAWALHRLTLTRGERQDTQYRIWLGPNLGGRFPLMTSVVSETKGRCRPQKRGEAEISNTPLQQPDFRSVEFFNCTRIWWEYSYSWVIGCLCRHSSRKRKGLSIESPKIEGSGRLLVVKDKAISSSPSGGPGNNWFSRPDHDRHHTRTRWEIQYYSWVPSARGSRVRGSRRWVPTITLEL